MAKRQNTFLVKRSNVPGKIPSPGDLQLGELALNTADVKLYTSGTTENNIIQIGWDKINRTGDTVTGDFIFNGDLTVVSGFTFSNGATNGYVLTSDAFGTASWQPLQTPGTSAIYSEILNFTQNIPITITHGFNTTNVLVQLINTNTNELIYGFIDNYQLNSIDVTLTESLNDIKVVIAGGTLVELSGITTNTFTTGATLNGTVLEFNRTDQVNAYNVDLSSIVSVGDTFVTGFTYDNQNKLTIKQNENKPDLDVVLNNFTGLTVNGDLNVINTSNLNSVTASTISNVEYIDFDINGNTQQESRLLWDDDSKTLQLGLRGGNTLEVGQKNVLFVVNDDSTQINKGEAVYVTSIIGGRVAVKKAIATDTLTSKAIGVALENIPASGNNQGFIVTGGVLGGINTSGFDEGEIIWLSDVVDGGITTDLPTKPNCRTRIGTVLNESATEGKIYINIQYSPRINSICDIDISGQTNGDLLIYNDSNGIWENKKELNGNYNIFGNLTISGETNLNTLTANTIGSSGNCVSDLYVSNIQSCSPLNINSNDEGNVFIGSTGITVDLSNNRVGLLTATPTETLDVNGSVRIRDVGSADTLNDVLVVNSDGVIHKRDITPSYGHFYVTNNALNTPISTTNTYQLVTGVPSLDVETNDFILNNPLDGTGTLLLDPAGDGGFESGTSFADNGWTVVNGAQVNQWFVGALGADTGSRGAYISNDGGTTNAYTTTTTSRTHFYRDITIPPGTAFLELTFRVRVQGEGTTSPFDFLRVNIATTAQTPTAGTLPPGTILDNYRLLGANFVSITINLTQASILTSSDIRLIFSWINDGSVGTQPPASVDNIEFKAFGGACCLRYIGTKEKVFNANVHLNARSSTANQTVTTAIIKNADPSVIKSSMPVNLSTANARYMMSTQDTFRLQPNDTITPVIKNNTSTASLLIEDINFIVKEI